MGSSTSKDKIGVKLQVGDTVEFAISSSDANFKGCPGEQMFFTQGSTHIISSVRGDFFTTTKWQNLWAPKSAILMDVEVEPSPVAPPSPKPGRSPDDPLPAILPAKAEAGAARAPPLPPPRDISRRRTEICPMKNAIDFVKSLGIDDAYFDKKFDRCYCAKCYKSGWANTIRNQGPTEYVIPRGWTRFGLVVHQGRANSLQIFEKWSTSFHGVKNITVLKSILDCGGLLKPGDKLLDGTKLLSTKCAGRQDRDFYTSPTIRYAGRKFYAEPQSFQSDTMEASIVLQCRQKPGTFRTQGETMGFDRWSNHLSETCPHVKLDEIEWLSDVTSGAIPYGLLVRVWPKGSDPEYENYRSPGDR